MNSEDGLLNQKVTSSTHRSVAAEVFTKLGIWAVFLSAAAFLLRPVLITAIAADDLINPFSQIYHAGTDIPSLVRRTWNSVTATGHFNYVGQAFGTFITSIWSVLIGDFGIRYSVVYATTKYLVYITCIEISARALRGALKFCATLINMWHLRITVLLAIALPIQIHIPWSNDPVASYPLSGYLTVAVGVAYILLVFKLIDNQSFIFSCATGIYGACAVLYYEFNSFAILASAPLFGYFIVKSLSDKTKLKGAVINSVFAVGPAAATTIFFYLRNRAASADYSGTAISFANPFPKTFMQGMISALPASSWNIAFDWLPHPLRYPATYWSEILVGLCLVALLLLFSPRWTPLKSENKVSALRFIIAASPFLIYWVGATFTQTSTIKVQEEAIRIGQVYNFYAVGAVCSAIIALLLLFLVNWKKVFTSVKVLLITAVLCLGVFQYVINCNITAHFNVALTGNRNLLAVFADQPPMAERCTALDAWKSMGWPEYYWLDMELGMNTFYLLYHGEQFCKR